MVYSEVNTILTIDATPYYYGYRTLCDHSLGSFLQLPCIGDTTMQGPARDRDPVHTLGSIFDATENHRCAIERAYVEGLSRPRYRQPRRACSAQSSRELRRRSAIEPVIGHMKTDGRLGRCRP
jgi:hypothetical protein